MTYGLKWVLNDKWNTTYVWIYLPVVCVGASLVQKNVCAETESCGWCILFSDAPPRLSVWALWGSGKRTDGLLGWIMYNVDSYFVLPCTGNSVLVLVSLSKDLIFFFFIYLQQKDRLFSQINRTKKKVQNTQNSCVPVFPHDDNI